MITAEQWRNGINSVLDEYGLSREEFWKDPKAFLDNLDDMDAKLTLEYFMEMADAYLNNCLPQIDDIIYRD